MKIRTKHLDYDRVKALPRPKHKKPLKPSLFFRTLIRIISVFDLMATRFSFKKKNMDKAGKGPYIILMNHSSFIDLEIAYKIMYPKPMCIVSTTDGLVGKAWLMRLIGCIPTQKFVSDMSLIRDISYAIKEKKTSVLMYPEAGYSFDGRATVLPKSLGTFVKRLGVPLVYIQTHGAFSYQPLYNCLKKRKVKVSADVECLLSAQEISEKSAAEIQSIIEQAFEFDSFAWQFENNIEIKEKYRAEGLERILYKCASCGKEGEMLGRGTELICQSCGKKYELTTYGKLSSEDGETFTHIPDWYDWERESVKRELEDGVYCLDIPVEIGMLVDHKALYMVGEGRLIHNGDGFNLTGCNGKLNYVQKPLSSYSLNSDYFWYEIGDVIGIGDRDCLYYCFPKKEGVVTKARLAAEELFKISNCRRENIAKKE